MSSPLPLPVQPGSQGGPVLRPGNSPVSSLGTESEGVFGGILGAQLQTLEPGEAALVATEQAQRVLASLAGGLPQDGNPLPGAETELPVTGLSLHLELEPDQAVPLAGAFQFQSTDTDGFGLTFQGEFGSAREPGIALQFALQQRGISLSGQLGNNGQVSGEDSANPVLPGLTLELDDTTLLDRQTRHSLSFQNLLIPANRQGEFGIEASRLGRVLEQFTDPAQRGGSPVQPVSLGTTGLATPLSEAGLTSTSSGLTQLSVDVPLQSERWQQVFAQRVVWSIGQNQSAQIRIHPEELGKIDIQLNLDNDKANVVFNTQQGVVKEAIESALPRLRELLAEQGIELGDVDIHQEDFQQQFAGQSGERESFATAEDGHNRSARNEGVPEQVITSALVQADDVIDYYI